MDILSTLAEMHGAARRRDLVHSWSGRQELTRLIEVGTVIDHGGGCYALPAAPEWVVRARQFRAFLTCVSWAQVHGLAVLAAPRQIHLAVPPDRSAKASPSRPATRVVLHRTAAAPSRLESGPPLISRPEAALACVLRCLEALPAIVTIDSALNKGVCTLEGIRGELVGRGAGRARSTLARCDGRSESLLETLARVELREAGLEVSTGVPIAGVGWVDMVVEGWIVVELDGFEFHSSRIAFGNDRRRDRMLASLGFTVLRFTYDEVVNLPGYVAAEVLATLAAPAVPRAQ